MVYSNRKYIFLFIFPAIFLMVLLLILPILYSFYLSLEHYNLNLPVITRKFVGFKNYISILTDENFLSSLSWTFIFSITAVLIELVLGTWFALLINNKLIKKQSNAFLTLLFLPMMTSPVVTAIMWKIIFGAKYGVVNYFLNLCGVNSINWLSGEWTSRVVIIITDVWQFTPFVMLIMTAALQTVPDELYDSARIDGANRSQTLFKITLPSIRNFVAIVVSVRFMDAIRYFDGIFILTNGGPGHTTETTGYTIYKYAFRYGEIGLGSAGGFIFLVLIIIISVFLLFTIQKKKEV